MADLRAATPTGAAELAVPNIIDLKALIKQYKIRSYQNINNYINIYLNKLKSLKESYILKNPLALYEVKEQKLSNYIDRLNTYIDNLLEKYKFNYKIILNKITLLNPLNILEKGYSVVSKDKEIIKSTKKLKANDEVVIKLYEGKLKALIKEIL